MSFYSSASIVLRNAARKNLNFAQKLALITGLIMPLVSAAVYPSYYFWMPTPLWEWTRLQEIPFVICESMFIGWAIVRGFEIRQIIRVLPIDCIVSLIIFLIGLWASTLTVSAMPVTSMTISMSYVIHLLFVCSVYFLLKGASFDVIEEFCGGLAWGLVALGLLAAWKFLLPPPASTLYTGTIVWQAALPGFINVRHFGSYTGAIAAIFATALICRKDDAPSNWWDFAYLLAIGMTIWSGTRAAILAIGLACLIMLISCRTYPSLRTVGRLSILTGISAILAYLSLPRGDEAFTLFSIADRYGSVDEVTSLRGTLWSLTYDEWMKAPWFGWGSGATFWQVPFPNWHHTQPHNFVLQFLISWGLVGAAGAFWLLGRALFAVHCKTLAQPRCWPLLVGLYSLLIMACLEGMLHYPRFIMLIMVLFAMIFSITAQPARTSHLSGTRLRR
jgi:exopolysaccharide production protein ExoQ